MRDRFVPPRSRPSLRGRDTGGHRHECPLQGQRRYLLEAREGAARKYAGHAAKRKRLPSSLQPVPEAASCSAIGVLPSRTLLSVQHGERPQSGDGPHDPVSRQNLDDVVDAPIIELGNLRRLSARVVKAKGGSAPGIER
jgi:hypothetical protein